MSEVDLDSWVPMIVAGDLRAFGEWMKLAELPLRRALRSFATQVDTEAVLQEALLRVWQVAPKLKPDGKPNSLLRMAHTIARNLAIGEARKLKTRRTTAPDVAPEQRPITADPNLRRVIAECREKLPDAPRKAIDARIQNSGGEPDATLAERCAMKKNTFLKNVGRARELLRGCLKKNGVDLLLELTP